MTICAFLAMYEPESGEPIECNLTGPIPGFRSKGFWIAELASALQVESKGPQYSRVLLAERAAARSIAELGAEPFSVYILEINNEQAVSDNNITKGADVTILGYAGECGCKKDHIYNAPAIPDRTLDDDIEAEERQPDLVIHIDYLDEQAMQEWWDAFRHNSDNVWDTKHQNCSTTVYDALRAGGGLPEWWPIWSPAAIAMYANEVKAQLFFEYVIATTNIPPIGIGVRH